MPLDPLNASKKRPKTLAAYPPTPYTLPLLIVLKIRDNLSFGRYIILYYIDRR